MCIRDRIKTFLEVLDNHVPFSEYQISNKKNDLGLVISKISPEDFIRETGQSNSWIVSNDFNFENILTNGISDNKNIIVYIKNDPENDFISQIKEYYSRGIITKKDKNAVIDPKNLLIICLISKEVLNAISYPYFESLFGPILELNDF